MHRFEQRSKLTQAVIAVGKIIHGKKPNGNNVAPTYETRCYQTAFFVTAICRDDWRFERRQKRSN
ncbi:MAG: hypothetical protein CMJ77_13015 [Planctomycetaceae bacterium]|nr:hypothetical protein [Planctomycetaceae bacterium]